MHGALIAVTCILGALIWGLYGGKRRRDAAPPEAKRLNLKFIRERNYRIVALFPFLKDINPGTNCYAFNSMSGLYNGHEITMFDYHVETAEKGAHHSSFFVLQLSPKSHPSKTTLADIQHLHPDLNIDLSPTQLALQFKDTLKTKELEPRLKQLIEIHDLILE